MRCRPLPAVQPPASSRRRPSPQGPLPSIPSASLLSQARAGTDGLLDSSGGTAGPSDAPGQGQGQFAGGMGATSPVFTDRGRIEPSVQAARRAARKARAAAESDSESAAAAATAAAAAVPPELLFPGQHVAHFHPVLRDAADIDFVVQARA